MILVVVVDLHAIGNSRSNNGPDNGSDTPGTMSRWVCLPFRVVHHIGVAIHSHSVRQCCICAHEPAAYGIIVAEVLVDQTRFAVEALAGKVVIGGHVAAAVARGAVGIEELHRLEAAAAGEGDGGTAQQVGQQVIECAGLAHGEAHAVDAVEFAGRRAAAVDDFLAVAVEGDGVGDAVAITGALQDTVAFVVVEEAVAGSGAGGSRPGGEATFVVVGHDSPGSRAAATDMGGGGIDVATGHVAHVVVGGVFVGNAAQAVDGMHVAVVVAYRSHRATGHAVQVVVAETLLGGADGRSGGCIAAVVAARWVAGVAGPLEPVEGIVTEALIIQQGAAAGGDGGTQLQHVAYVVIGARLVPDRRAIFAGAGGEWALDAVVAHAHLQDGSDTAPVVLGAGATQAQTFDLTGSRVGGGRHQEIDGIGGAAGAEIG